MEKGRRKKNEEKRRRKERKRKEKEKGKRGVMMRDVIDERGGVVMGCGPRGGEWAGSVEEKKRKERKKRMDWNKNNNIIILSRKIDCSRKIPKNTRR